MGNPALNLLGQKFGHLTVIERAGTTEGPHKKAKWLCLCDCGNKIVRVSQSLRSNHRKNQRHCGCRLGEFVKKHGATGEPGYNSWTSMRRRCLSPIDKDWKNYGGRGITICERWSCFAAFWEDMCPSYKPGLTLGRIDNEGNYEPSNCRWETSVQQGNNTRITVS